MNALTSCVYLRSILYPVGIRFDVVNCVAGALETPGLRVADGITDSDGDIVLGGLKRAGMSSGPSSMKPKVVDGTNVSSVDAPDRLNSRVAPLNSLLANITSRTDAKATMAVIWLDVNTGRAGRAAAAMIEVQWGLLERHASKQ